MSVGSKCRHLKDEELCFTNGVLGSVVDRSERGDYTWKQYLQHFRPKFLRQAFVEHAGESIRHSEWAQPFYVAQKPKGKTPQAAVRALAYKWIRIIFRCWQTREKYDVARYIECLRKKGSKLVTALASAESSEESELA